MKKWECGVCGYIHEGDAPPEECPVCGADRSRFVELIEPEIADATSGEIKPPQPKAPDSSEPQPATKPEDPDTKDSLEEDSVESTQTPFQKYSALLIRLMVKHHAHPISVHIPNGVLPVSVIFLVLSILFQTAGLEAASFYNMIFVLLSMPLVLFSGYNDWKHRLGGNMTNVILTKMICGGVVFTLALVVVIWRWLDPLVAISTSNRVMYLFLHLIMLGAAVTAGLMGGKLIRFPGDGRRS